MKTLTVKLGRTIWRNFAQASSIAAVLGCGVFVLVATLICYRSLKLTQAMTYDRSAFSDVTAQVKQAPLGITPRLGQLSGVRRVEPRITVDTTIEFGDGKADATGHFVGIPDHRPPSINRITIQQGRLPAAPNEVVVSSPFAKARKLEPGDTLTVRLGGRRRSLSLVGVGLSPEFIFHIGPGALFPDDELHGVVWMPMSGLASALGMQGGANEFVLVLGRNASERAVIDAVDRVLLPYGGLGAQGRDNQVSHRYLSDEIEGLYGTAIIVPGIFLAVAAFLVHVVVSRMVASEREQIAMLKALGYTNRDIGMHYAAFALIIAGAGGVLGAAGGTWGGRAMAGLYKQFYHFPVLEFRLDSSVIVIAVGASLLVALTGTAIAVRSAVRLEPAAAMRPPAPRRMGPSIVTRLGFIRSLAPMSRMVVRDVESRPFRALITAAAIAQAVSIVIVGDCTYESIDQMIDKEFFAKQRQDADVLFRAPVSADAIRELERDASVRRAEPFRMVPIRLRSAHRTYKTALLSTPSISTFRDVPLAIREMPNDGAARIALPQALAGKLDLRLGDPVDIDQLQGRRGHVRAEVAHLSTDLMGMIPQTSDHVVDTLTGESNVMTGAWISMVDPSDHVAVARINDMPQVMSVFRKQSSLRAFEESSKQFRGVFSMIVGAFAMLIAFGVVYNSGRVLLVDRIRELASLRVLGFTEAEVFARIIAELALPTLLGLPAGWWLGAWLSEWVLASASSDLMRIPAVIPMKLYVKATFTVLAASVGTGVVIWRAIRRIDLAGSIKTYE